MLPEALAARHVPDAWSSSATATSPDLANRWSRRCPNATLRTLRNVDHFATPEAFGFIDAALEFLDADPL